MKIVIITQEDPFVIPVNLEMVYRMKDIKIQMLITANVSGSLINRRKIFIKGFGLYQSFKMGLRLMYYKILDFLRFVPFINIKNRSYSVKSFARKYHIKYSDVKTLDSDLLISDIKSVNPDLIVSFSAPCVFKNELLKIPSNGCINLHCSYLPNYAGLLPSFWVLYNKEHETGVTVHYMDDKIDNGMILAQKKLLIPKNITMYKLINKTKIIGGQLICHVINQINSNKIKLQQKHVERNYYTWPTVEEIKKFRQNGGRLI